jgi:hypothetical protein
MKRQPGPPELRANTKQVVKGVKRGLVQMQRMVGLMGLAYLVTGTGLMLARRVPWLNWLRQRLRKKAAVTQPVGQTSSPPHPQTNPREDVAEPVRQTQHEPVQPSNR